MKRVVRRVVRNVTLDVLFNALYHTRVYRLLQPGFSGIGTILLFHRVVEDNGRKKFVDNREMEVSLKYFEQVILFLKGEGFEFISLDEVYERLSASRINHDLPRFVSFTFDDGYVDLYTLAYPLLKKYDVPFTIYVTTGFPDKNALLWWYMLEDLLLNRNEISFVYRNRRYHFLLETDYQKENAYGVIRKLFVGAKASELDDVVGSVFGGYKIESKPYVEEMTLSWEQIRALSELPLVTIGAHTVNHYALSRLSKRKVIDEIQSSREVIESHIGKKVEHFSYPFGKRSEAGEREFDVARNCGFKTCTTTRYTNVFPEHRDYLQCLPRFNVSGCTEDLSWMKVLLSGSISAFVYKFRRVISE